MRKGRGERGQKDHSWLLPALDPHSYKETSPASSLHVIVSPDTQTVPEASSLGGLAKMMDTDLVSRSICLKPILSITIQRGWLSKQTPSQSCLLMFPCLTALCTCHSLQRMRLSQGGSYHPMATGNGWSSLTGQPQAPQCLPAISHTQS